MGAVYIIRNGMNDKVYVGKTNRSVELRWKEHIRAINDPDKKSSIHFAMKKYGVENFSLEVLEENIPEEKLNEREQYYINKFDSFHHGYNRTMGGEGESHVDRELIMLLYNRGYSYTEIGQLTGYSRKTISAHIKGNVYVSPEKHHARGVKIKNGKRVQYDGKTFSSHKELAEYLINNDSDFKGKCFRTVLNYLSRHKQVGEVSVVHAKQKRKSRKGVPVKSHATKGIDFGGVHYKAYKDLAIFLIDNFDCFKNSKINTVIQGISYSINKKKPYKSFCFY